MQKKLSLSQGIIILIALHLPTVVFSEEPEAISLLGKQLYRSALQGDLEQLQSNLKQAQADYEKNPEDPERIIWLGRRTAYLWRYHDAIDIYSKGINKHPNYQKLYRNRGDGTFENVTAAAGIENDGWSGSATFFDYDLDGFLDLYVTQYVKFYGQQCYDSAGRHEYCGPKAYKPAHDVLMHNNGDPAAPGFTDVSEQAGISSMAAAGLGGIGSPLGP